MRIIIDDELKAIITEDWVKNALGPVDPFMLNALTIKFIDPSKNDKFQDRLDATGWNLDSEELMEELGRRLTLGFCRFYEQIVELYIRPDAWKYYAVRRSIVIALYHEIYHVNDPESNQEWTPNTWESPYWDHPREIRARKFEKKTFQRLKGKRKIIMTNAEVMVDILDKNVKGGYY